MKTESESTKLNLFLFLACEQALIFVVIIDVARAAIFFIIDVARAAKPRVTSRRAHRAGEGSCQTPRWLVTRGFAARTTSIITTKMRACSQAILFFVVLLSRIAWPRRVLFCFITIAKGLLFRKYIAIHFFFRQPAVYRLDS